MYMDRRTRARELTMQALYQLDIQGPDLFELLEAFFTEADEYALECSQNMEKDRPPPPMPDQFRAIQYYFIRSPALDGIQSFYRDKVLEMRYLAAGLGITFTRNEKYPGGCYFITLLLLPGT